MKQVDKYSSFDRTVYNLCEEIDYWKEQAEYYKNQFEQERNSNIKQSNEALSAAKQGVANALLFALSVKETSDGCLVIDKEARKTLSKNFKKE